MHRMGYHAYAVDQQGREVMDTGFLSDMTVYADFNVGDDGPEAALGRAREWATRNMRADRRLAAVHIRQSVQEHPGQYWRAGPGVETIERERAMQGATYAYSFTNGGRRIEVLAKAGMSEAEVIAHMAEVQACLASRGEAPARERFEPAGWCLWTRENDDPDTDRVWRWIVEG